MEKPSDGFKIAVLRKFYELQENTEKLFNILMEKLYRETKAIKKLNRNPSAEKCTK
jgi:hypothetical protein